jgi:hypothetical protein
MAAPMSPAAREQGTTGQVAQVIKNPATARSDSATRRNAEGTCPKRDAFRVRNMEACADTNRSAAHPTNSAKERLFVHR